MRRQWSRHPPLRLGLVQFAPVKGDVPGNLDRVRRLVEKDGADHDLLLFPEAAPTGYFLEGGVEEGARELGEVIDGLGPPPEGGGDLVLGFYERSGPDLHNSVVHLEPAGDSYRSIHLHRKVFLPTYGVFDESRFVTPGASVQAYDTRFGRMGLLVCEEVLHSITPTILALDGAELLLAVSASPARGVAPGPGRPGNLARWESAVSAAALEHGVFFALVQLVGSEGGRIFPGGSVACGPEGRVIGRGPVFEESVTTLALDGGEIGRARTRGPTLADLRSTLSRLRPDLERAGGMPGLERAGGTPGLERAGGTGGKGRGGAPPPRPALQGRGGMASGPQSLPRPGDPSAFELDPALVERALTRFLEDEIVRRRGFRRVLVGVSGGVDSAAVLLLAARAFGPENVHALRLPYATSRPESLEHAQLVIDRAGVPSRTIDITPSVDAYVDSHDPGLSPRRRGNLAARFRAMVLFDQGEALEALPLGTGNKSERLMGYFTWHADDSPPVNPLGDLFKTQVLALAAHLGVPPVVVSKPPSADLVEGVDDADELGIDYDRADPILHWLLRGYSPDELVERGFPSEEVEIVRGRLEGTHWKRRPPTVAMLSDTSIGDFYLRPVDF